MGTGETETAQFFDLPSEAATAALARRLARLSRAGDVIALSGELGAGKTAFARAFIRTLCGGGEEVPSPTFTLVQVYERHGDKPAIWHFDLYRLEHPEEVFELGFEEASAGAIVLVEWPERMGTLLPPERLQVRLAPGASPRGRRVELRPSPAWRPRMAELTP